MNRKWNKFLFEIDEVEQIVYEVSFLIRYPTQRENYLNFTRLKDEIRAIKNITTVKTFEAVQILAGFTYKELIVKVALDPDSSVKQAVEEIIIPKLKKMEEFVLVKHLSTEELYER
jgi:hypothetical protein